jgi:hypothetical protein
MSHRGRRGGKQAPAEAPAPYHARDARPHVIYLAEPVPLGIHGRSAIVGVTSDSDPELIAKFTNPETERETPCPRPH